jgi:hypothetical protein
MDNKINVPLIIRGEIIEDYEVEYGGRGGNVRFKTPDVTKYLDRLMNDDPLSLSDLYSISLDDIIDFLAELGRRLDLDKNPHWREAFEVSCLASNLSRSVLEHLYRTCSAMFRPAYVRDGAHWRGVSRRLGAAHADRRTRPQRSRHGCARRTCHRR